MRDKVLNYIIDNTDKATFEIALRNHNLHLLYRRNRKHLLYTYFNGHELHYSIFMANLFNEFITEGAQIEAAQLDWEIRQLTAQIRRAKKYKSTWMEYAKEHNKKVTRYNELMIGTNRLIDLWNKRHKKAPADYRG